MTKEQRPILCYSLLSVHGGWGEWGEWSRCSLTCGLGKKTRERMCNKPVPKYGGTPCDNKEKIQPGYCRIQRCDTGQSCIDSLDFMSLNSDFFTLL